MGVLRARSLEEFGELLRHPGEEFIFVLDGQIELHTKFYEPMILKPGEGRLRFLRAHLSAEGNGVPLGVRVNQ